MNWQIVLEQIKNVMSYSLFTVQESHITLFSLIVFLLIMFGAVIASRYIRSLFRSRFSQRFEGGLDYTLRRLLHYVILVVGFLLGLETVGISLSSLAIVAGFLSVGIGFGLQNIASNFISGLILLFERPIKVGDMVTVGDDVGTVESIKLRATEVKTLDNIDLIIPNSSFIEQNVTNWSHGEEKIRLRSGFGVAYGSDTNKVKETVEKIASEHKQVLDEPAPVVLFREFGDSSLNFELRFWVETPRNRPRVLSEINFEIDRVFREKGIEMPFPQRDIHIRSDDTREPSPSDGE